jgi:dipeptidyl aminopeptidase/acylaminoacyl peptidase
VLKTIQLNIFLAFLLFAVATSATPSLKDYGTLPEISMVTVSPDGSLIAFRKVVDEKDILVVTSLAEKKVVMMLDLTKIEPRDMFFINNEQVYLLVSKYQRVAGFRGKFDTSTGYVVDIKTQKIRQLLIPGEDNIYPGQAGLGGIIGISPDGEYAYMPGYIGNTGLVLGSTVKPGYGLMKVKLKSKERHKTLTSGTIYSDDFFVDNNGNLLAEERFNDKSAEHTVWVFIDGKEKELFKENVSIRSKAFVGLTPDYTALVFLENNSDTDRDDYYLMDLKTAKISSTDFGKENADIEYTIKDRNRIIRGVVYSGFSPSYKFFDSKLDQRMQSILSQFPEQSVYLESTSPDWKHILVKVEGSQYPGDYFLFTEGSDEIKFLTSSRPNISPEDINPIGKLTCTARDGLKIPTLITIPKDKLSSIKDLPAVIFPHGGPAHYDRIEFDFFTQALASQGYLVIQPQFRGSTGFGSAFTAAGNKEWGKKAQDDISDAVLFFAKKGYINPDKVCIAGMSYGGYAALAGGAFTPELYKCVVSINGIGDLYDMYTFDRNEHQNNQELLAILQKRFAANAAGEVDKKQMHAVSPEKFAHQFTAPVLLIHSENDKIVPYKQSDSMESALKRAKKTVQLIKLEGDNHHLLESKTRLQALEETVKFVNQQLK